MTKSRTGLVLRLVLLLGATLAVGLGAILVLLGLLAGWRGAPGATMTP